MKKLLLSFAVSCFIYAGDAEAFAPRLAAMAMPGGIFTPQHFPAQSNRPLVRAIPKVVALASRVASFFPPPVSWIGSAVPIGIRLAHVVVNGSLTPRRPLKTAAWVISPNVAQRLHERRRFR